MHIYCVALTHICTEVHLQMLMQTLCMYVCMHNVEEHKEAHACKQTGVHAHRNTVSYAE